MGKKRGFLAGLFFFVGVLLTLLGSAASYAQTATIELQAVENQGFEVRTYADSNSADTGQVSGYQVSWSPWINYKLIFGEWYREFHRYRFDHPTIPNNAITNVRLSFTAHKSFGVDDPTLDIVIPKNTYTCPYLGWGVLSSNEYGELYDCILGGNVISDNHLAFWYTAIFQVDISSTSALDTLLTSLLPPNPLSFAVAVYSDKLGSEITIDTPMTAALTYNVAPITNNTICCDDDLVGVTDPSVLTGSIPAGGDYLNYTYQWQSSLNNSIWSNVSGATAINYDPPTISQTTYYRRIINSGPSTPSTSNVVTLTVWPLIAGNTICCDQSFVNVTTADPANLIGSVPTGGTGVYSYQWYSSPNGFASWASVGAPPFGQNIDPNIITQTRYYQRVVLSGSGGLGASFSNVIKVSVIKPKAAYSFDNTTSLAAIAHDDTGNGYDGVLPSPGATSVQGKIGSALNFLPDNNIQEFSVQSSSAIVDMNILEEMTGIAWVRPMGAQSTDNNPGCTEGTIFSKGGSYWFQLSQNNRQIHFQNEGSGTEIAIANYPANGGIFPLNQWTQVAFVRGPWDTTTQSQSIKLYVNGDYVTTTTGGLAGDVDGYPSNSSPVGPNLLLNPAASNNSPLMVGNYGFLNDPGACEFNGDIDEINIYDVALSAAEIMSQYQSYPAIVISISPATPAAGQLITLKAEVTGYSPTGTVQFKVNNVRVGSPVTLTNGLATLTTSLNSGANAITATYSGDANNATSTTVTPFTVTVPGISTNDADIPTLPEWAMIILASLLLGTGVWKQRMSRRAY